MELNRRAGYATVQDDNHKVSGRRKISKAVFYILGMNRIVRAFRGGCFLRGKCLGCPLNHRIEI